MPILTRLVDFYQSRGYRIATGLNPRHVENFSGAPFTWLIKDGRSVTNGLGIAAQEVYFLECLGAALRPQSAFVIGNSFGWSTFALALSCPEAKVLAIDAGFDANSVMGIELTNRIAADETLDVLAVKAASPDGVAGAVAAHCRQPFNLVFIDGKHTNEQIELDFEAVRPHLAEGAVVLFHDVLEAHMGEGFRRVAATPGFTPIEVLMGTSSGMAALVKGPIEGRLQRVLDAFSAPPEVLELIRAEAWKARHPLLAKWRRSLTKRLARLGGG